MNRYTEELLTLIAEEATSGINEDNTNATISKIEALINDLKAFQVDEQERHYKFVQLSPEAQQRAIDDYRNALIADGVPTDEVDDDWGLCYDLQRYQLDYYANGERYKR